MSLLVPGGRRVKIIPCTVCLCIHLSLPALCRVGFRGLLATGLLGLHLLITLCFGLHREINCFPVRGKVKDV